MSRLGAITRFATGTYTVSRFGAPAWADGLATKATASTFSIVACIQPVGGREIRALPEGRRGDEVRVVYTATLLRTESSSGSADTISVGGETWEVIKVETWDAWSVTHYRAYISRVAVP